VLPAGGGAWGLVGAVVGWAGFHGGFKVRESLFKSTHGPSQATQRAAQLVESCPDSRQRATTDDCQHQAAVIYHPSHCVPLPIFTELLPSMTPDTALISTMASLPAIDWVTAKMTAAMIAASPRTK